jgi:hypothetical protein
LGKGGRAISQPSRHFFGPVGYSQLQKWRDLIPVKPSRIPLGRGRPRVVQAARSPRADRGYGGFIYRR